MSSEDCQIQIVTGANNSGKSVYMKSIGQIVYLAHIGCFVPAKFATIGLLQKIFSRLGNTESLSCYMSTFQEDLLNMSIALQNSEKVNCLLLVDEFGKGTCSQDGIALLASLIINLAQERQNVLALFATHFYEVAEFVPNNNKIQYFQTQIFENTFSYIIQKGISKDSHAFQCANILGMNQIAQRAQEVKDCLLSGKKLKKMAFSDSQIEVIKDILNRFRQIENDQQWEAFANSFLSCQN